MMFYYILQASTSILPPIQNPSLLDLDAWRENLNQTQTNFQLLLIKDIQFHA